MRFSTCRLAGLCAIIPVVFSFSGLPATWGNNPIQIGFLWHMHQPIYYPYESPIQTDANNRFSFSVVDVHNQRVGPYTTWPRNAVQAGLHLPNLGAQVSFSGSLIENLNHLRQAGVNGGMWNNWDAGYDQARQWQTSLGNPRIDLVGFGYHHPLMPLLDERDIRMQIRLHKHIYGQTFGGSTPYSRGIFPAETAFSSRMIPALVAEGMEWALVDNIHFDRATVNYPYTPASNLMPPNRADQINPDPAANGGDWVQLQNIWAPSRVSAPFSYRPAHVQHVNPNTGEISKIVAVPAARYEGNEDGRGGYGAFLYEQVMNTYLPYNTDPNRPMFVVLHHDGDNFGGGSHSYYHSNFQNMVNWVSSAPNYRVSTIQDYLDRFPVPANEVIHVEPGSWAGADNGDPQFKKWLGDPGPNGWSPDRNSWAVLTAAKNRVFTADDIAPVGSMQNVMTGNGTATERAWHHLLVSQASDYWYWDGTEIWDSNVTRGSNQAVAHANQVIQAFTGTERTPPSVFLPQRGTYNPGGIEWGPNPTASDFEVWTFAYDVSGLSSVKLKWRADADGFNPLHSIQNETYAGGSEVGAWNEIVMSSSDVSPPPGILAPTYRAQRYSAMINGQRDVLLDYYVEAVDLLGNVTKSDIQQVYVGMGQTSGGDRVTLTPSPAVAGDPVTIAYDPAGGPLVNASQVFVHYGFNDWNPVASPDRAMTWDPGVGRWFATIDVSSQATQLDLVFNNGAGVWDNNQGSDWHFPVTGGNPGFQMDGVLDAGAVALAQNGTRRLHAALDGEQLYVATNDAGEGQDIVIYVANQPGALVPANWAKAGRVAQWDAYLADENDNGFSGWFEAAAGATAATGANGGVLEGLLNLVSEMGELPLDIYIAVGAFATANGGALNAPMQIPMSANGNGDIEAIEYLRVQLHLLRTGDFHRDGSFDCSDANAIVARIVAGDDQRSFDLTGDGLVDQADLSEWLVRAGRVELGSGNPFLPGDANLDGVVDGSDFGAWNANKFTSGAGWCGGDFNADGVVDGSDFGVWNTNKFRSSGSLRAVPEPLYGGLAGLSLAILGLRRRRA